MDVEGKRCSNPGHGSYYGSSPGHGGNEMFPLDMYNNNYFIPAQICSSVGGVHCVHDRARTFMCHWYSGIARATHIFRNDAAGLLVEIVL